MDREDEHDWLAIAKSECEAATPGPWVREDDWTCEVNAPELRELGVESVTYKNVVKLAAGLDRLQFNGAADADFIAAARTHLPHAITALEAADRLADAVRLQRAGQDDEAWQEHGCPTKQELDMAVVTALAAFREARK